MNTKDEDGEDCSLEEEDRNIDQELMTLAEKVKTNKRAREQETLEHKEFWEKREKRRKAEAGREQLQEVLKRIEKADSEGEYFTQIETPNEHARLLLSRHFQLDRDLVSDRVVVSW